MFEMEVYKEITKRLLNGDKVHYIYDTQHVYICAEGTRSYVLPWEKCFYDVKHPQFQESKTLTEIFRKATCNELHIFSVARLELVNEGKGSHTIIADYFNDEIRLDTKLLKIFGDPYHLQFRASDDKSPVAVYFESELLGLIMPVRKV